MNDKLILKWCAKKNLILKRERGITFEDVELAILAHRLIKIVEHHNSVKYPNQKIMQVDINGYIYCVPFVINKDNFFLKTIYPSRKANKTRNKQ